MNYMDFLTFSLVNTAKIFRFYKLNFGGLCTDVNVQVNSHDIIFG